MRQMPMVRTSLLMKLLLVFIFFLPLRFVQIPVHVIGFEINPARIASVLLVLVLAMNGAIDVHFLHALTRSLRYRNPFVARFFLYLLGSIAYYYLLVALHQTIRFGEGQPFFRNWQGRPFSQFLAFGTYAIVPFFLVQYYAQRATLRRKLERALTAALLIIVYFGIVQTAWYIAFGVPLIGRVLWERPLDLGFVTIAGIPFYRLHSLAGEPRDLGAFLVGAIPFYLYIRTAAQRWTVFLNAAAMVAIFFLTMSTTAYLVGAVTIGIIILDTLVRKRRPIRPRHIAYGCATIAVVSALIYGQVAQLLMVRTFAMVGAIQAQIALREIQPIAAEQATNVVALYYLRSLVEMPLHIVFFGGGYSNFITPTAGLMQRYFGRSFAAGDIPTADAFAVKLLIEGGLVGIGLYVVLFITMLRCNGRLLAHFRVIGDREGYRRAVFLRYAYIGFFVAGSLQTSYFVFIVMGLMIGWANEVLHGTKPHGDRHTMGLPAPPLHDYAPVSAR